MYTPTINTPCLSVRSSQSIGGRHSLALQFGDGVVAVGLGDLPRDILHTIKLKLYYELTTLRELTLASKAIRSLFTAEEHQFIKLDAQLIHLYSLIKQNVNDKLNDKFISAFSAIVAKAEALLNQAELSQSQPQLIFTLLNWLAVQNAERCRLRLLLCTRSDEIVDQADILEQYKESCELLIDKAWLLLTNEQLYQQSPGLAYQVMIFLTDVKYFRITEEDSRTLTHTHEVDHMLASGGHYDIQVFKVYFKLMKALPHRDAGYQAVKLFMMTFSTGPAMGDKSAEHVPEVLAELFELPITFLEAYKESVNQMFCNFGYYYYTYEKNFPDPLRVAISELLALEPVQKLIGLGASTSKIKIDCIIGGISQIGWGLGNNKLYWFQGLPLREPAKIINWYLKEELYKLYSSDYEVSWQFKYLLKEIIGKYRELGKINDIIRQYRQLSKVNKYERGGDLIIREELRTCCSMIIHHPKFIINPQDKKDKKLIGEVKQLFGKAFVQAG